MLCPRSTPSTKRLISFSRESYRENRTAQRFHTASFAISGQQRDLACPTGANGVFESKELFDGLSNRTGPPDPEFHPLAHLFPEPDAEQLAALEDDIRKHGLREPMVLYQAGEE
jgi:hypothetical protein